MFSYEKVKKFLQELDTENIHFKKHFTERVRERPINQGMTIKLLKQTDKLWRIALNSQNKKAILRLEMCK